MLSTLLLSENTPIAMAGLLFLVPIMGLLLLPIVLLSRPNSSQKSKIIAFGLALLPAWLGSGISDEFKWMEYGWLVSAFFYSPLVLVLVNVIRGENKPKDTV
jgi:hypothetical protein